MAMSVVHINRWIDPLVEPLGHPADSTYAELFWLPVLGPSATFLLRRLALILEHHPEGFSIDLFELSSELGLGRPASRHAALPRAIDRCIRFSMVKRLGEQRLDVRTMLGPLPPKRVEKLTPALRSFHARWHSQLAECTSMRDELARNIP
jgi:hypothetical protein